MHKLCSLFIYLSTLAGFTANGETRIMKLKPTLLYVHGGAWVSGSAAQYESLRSALESRGNCVNLLDYRLASVARHPAQVDDLNTAIESLTSSKTPGCSSSVIILVGHSAGAHMIADWAAHHGNPSVRGFIGIAGIYDIPNLVRTWPAYKDQFIVDEFGPEKAKSTPNESKANESKATELKSTHSNSSETTWTEASPTRQHIRHRAPWLLLHSRKDELVDLEQSQAFERHLKSAKIETTLKILKNDSHFGVIKSVEDPNTDASLAIYEFISDQTRKMNQKN